MRRINPHRLAVFAVLVSNVLATTGWAQDADEKDEDGSDTATQVESATSEEPVIEDYASAEPASEDDASAEPVIEDYASAEPTSEEIDVDDGSYIDAEEEDFRPSEEIGADQSITFPTDI